MQTITTVLGDINPNQLAFCQSHEHLCIAKGQSFKINPSLCIDDYDKTLAELTAYKSSGGGAIVDAQPVGCGRQAEVLTKLSLNSDVNIIASTGFHKLCFYPTHHWIFGASLSQLEAIFTSELTCGMYIDCDSTMPTVHTSARAGQIKTALESNFEDYRSLFAAAAAASKKTRAAIMVHVEKGADPIALCDFFEHHGVNLEKVIFCHMDRMVDDLGIHEQICSRGAYLEYDTIARPKYHSDEREVEIITHMINIGYATKLLLSLDVTRERLISYGGTVGLAYILNSFVPLLKRNDIQSHHFFHTNPQTVFAKESL